MEAGSEEAQLWLLGEKETNSIGKLLLLFDKNFLQGDTVMKKSIVLFSAVLIMCLAGQVLANSAPVVNNVTASQQGDDSKLVDIHYDLADVDGDPATVWIAVSDDGGTSWRVPARTFTGDIGQDIMPGTNKSVVWDAGADMPGKVGSYKVRVFADDGNGAEEMVLVTAGWFPYQNVSDPCDWIYLDSFLIDKYEITNQRYCEFLNNSDPDGTYWSSDMEIYIWGDPGNHTYTVHDSKENHPIRYVSHIDADAFATWWSGQKSATYRLPTVQEWEKAAGWDPFEQHHYTYGFHRDSISSIWCNYNNYYAGPLPVGSFNGTGGKNNAKSFYGCYDMSGNIWEWTSLDVARGGAWMNTASYCTTLYNIISYPASTRIDNLGFRLVSEID